MDDLRLHPSDPLNLLLNSSPNTDSDSASASSVGSAPTPPEWSELASMWLENSDKSDFAQGMQDASVDMNYNPNMSIDPNALHTPTHQEMFPFTFQSPPIDHNLKESMNDPAYELAQRVRLSSGVMLALPNGPNLHSYGLTIPIPEQQQMSMSSASSSSLSPESTPPPSTPSPTLAHAVPMPMSYMDPFQQQAPKTKTSHTTIERRYRTNLNTRIQALRMAVPALRVLEEKEVPAGGPGKKGGKGKLSGRVGIVKSGAAEEGDVVDDRGYIDGVKVARKVSKANVLGKAVEYIRVLKKREMRLRNELGGLKELVGGLVGGKELVDSWEKEWREQFGGEEKDELEENELIDGDGDNGSDDEGDSDDDGGRKRKKAKVDSKPATQQPNDGSAPPVVLEKRKRGRPRKNPLPPPVDHSQHQQHQLRQVSPQTLANMGVGMGDPSAMAMSSFVEPPPVYPHPQQHQQQIPQYLLATFALFSFFNNSPFSAFGSGAGSSTNMSSDYGHKHFGYVITSSKESGMTFNWQALLQCFHLFVSVLVFGSMVLPWLPAKFTNTINKLLKFVSSRLSRHPVPPAIVVQRPSNDGEVDEDEDDSDVQSIASSTVTAGTDDVAPATKHDLVSALSPSQRGSPSEVRALQYALRNESIFSWKRDSSFERKGLKQRAWFRLGELLVLQVNAEPEPSIPTLRLLQTYYQMRVHMPWFSASASDLAMLAMVLEKAASQSRIALPFVRSRAKALWETARVRAEREGERVVFEEIAEVGGALEVLGKVGREEREKRNPVEVVAAEILERRMRKGAEEAFVGAVLGEEMEDEKRKEIKSLVVASIELGGDTRKVAESLKRVVLDGIELEPSSEHVDSGDPPTQIITALSLFRRISSLDENEKTELRLTLDHPVFDSGEAIDEARDTVVRMLEPEER